MFSQHMAHLVFSCETQKNPRQSRNIKLGNARNISIMIDSRQSGKIQVYISTSLINLTSKLNDDGLNCLGPV